MILRNEADGWLAEALEAHRPFIDDAVIIDDASTDKTVETVRRCLDGVPFHLVQNAQSRFANEIELRRQQWSETLSNRPRLGPLSQRRRDPGKPRRTGDPGPHPTDGLCGDRLPTL